MGALFSMLFGKIAEVVEWVVSLVKQLATDAWEFATDVPLWFADQLFGLVAGIVAELDLSGLDQWTQGAWSDLPAEVLNALAYLGAAEAGAIILAAIGIRLVLQLIPFTRLGS